MKKAKKKTPVSKKVIKKTPEVLERELRQELFNQDIIEEQKERAGYVERWSESLRKYEELCKQWDEMQKKWSK
jgi:hypothetical protein